LHPVTAHGLIAPGSATPASCARTTAPAATDCRAARTLAAEAIDLTLPDRLIFAKRNPCQSLRRMGLL